MDCESIVKKKVCVDALVTLTPDVDIGNIRSVCVDGPEIHRCPGSDDSCSFVVSQLVCVKIPLRFSAKGTAEPAGIACCVPREPCKSRRPDCMEQPDPCWPPERPCRKHTYRPCEWYTDEPEDEYPETMRYGYRRQE